MTGSCVPWSIDVLLVALSEWCEGRQLQKMFWACVCACVRACPVFRFCQTIFILRHFCKSTTIWLLLQHLPKHLSLLGREKCWHQHRPSSNSCNPYNLNFVSAWFCLSSFYLLSPWNFIYSALFSHKVTPTDPDPFSGSVFRSEKLQRETSGADQWNHFKTDLIGPLHWFPIATDRIARLSQTVDLVLNVNGESKFYLRFDNSCFVLTDLHGRLF